jgi:hypothetical protein
MDATFIPKVFVFFIVLMLIAMWEMGDEAWHLITGDTEIWVDLYDGFYEEMDDLPASPFAAQSAT